MTKLILDFYDVGVDSTAWCWSYGDWSSEEYASEFLARQALRAGTLVFSKIDKHDGYIAALLGAKVNSDLTPPFDYWVINNTWVFEPNIGGKRLGKVSDVKIQKGDKILQITRAQFNLMLDAYEEANERAP